MTAAYDHYAETRRVIGTMRDEGFEDAAQALEDAMAAGFTSTEILMALRWHLDNFLDGNSKVTNELRDSAKMLRKRINRTLA